MDNVDVPHLYLRRCDSSFVLSRTPIGTEGPGVFREWWK